MRAWIAILIFLPAFALAAEGVSPPIISPTAPGQGFPQPIVIFNYGTYHGGPAPAAAGPSTTAVPATAAQTMEVLKMKESDYTNGFGILMLVGMTAKEATFGAQIDFRFGDYLGLEAHGMRSVASRGSNLQSGYFFGPKVQIPFKSRLVDFTPTGGLGYGGWDVGGVGRKGWAILLRAEIAIANFLVVRGSLISTLGNDRQNNYQGFGISQTSEQPEYSDSFECGTPYLATGGIASDHYRYEAVSLSAGIRLRNDIMVGADLTQRRAQTSPSVSKSLLFEVKF